MSEALWMLRATTASFRPTRLPWPIRWSISAFEDVLTVCLGKSTYARCGIIVNVTPLEPEWEGHVTLEFSNTTTLPAKIYANEGVAQMLFFQSDERCETTYKDRGGKYQTDRGNPAKNVVRSFEVRNVAQESVGLADQNLSRAGSVISGNNLTDCNGRFTLTA